MGGRSTKPPKRRARKKRKASKINVDEYVAESPGDVAESPGEASHTSMRSEVGTQVDPFELEPTNNENTEVFLDALSEVELTTMATTEDEPWVMEDVLYTTDFGVDGQEKQDKICEAAGQEESDKKLPAKISASAFTSGFVGSQNSARFFWEEHNCSLGGLRSMVARCEFGMTSMANDLSLEDVKFVTETARFCHSLSRGQRHHFARILQMTEIKSVKDRNIKEKDRPWKVGIPRNYLDIRQNITEYEDAFLNILPTPRVESIGSNFAYVGLQEVVQNFLAFGYDLAQCSPNSTEKVSQIVDC